MKDNLDLQTTYRAILDAARQQRFISYGDLAKANGADWNKVWRNMPRHLGELVKLAVECDWPMLSAIVVKKSNLETGILDGDTLNGFISAAKEFGLDVQDPQTFVKEQQEATFAWASEAPDDLGLPIPQVSSGPQASGPKYVQFFGPVLDALRTLGGRAEPRDVMEKVKELAGVTPQELNELKQDGRSKYKNDVEWARFYLSKAKLIDNKRSGYWELTAEGHETYLDYASALALFRDIDSRFRSAKDDNIANDEDAPAPEPLEDFVSDLFDDPERSFWFVGAFWDGYNQTERFISEGIWTNGHENKYEDRVQCVKPGDRIAIKAAHTQKYGLPFENRNISVSCMRIKAIGTVTEGTQDGRSVKVEWTPLDKPKEWFFYTYRVTIVEADVSDEFARRLVQFTFGDHKQDCDFWLRQPYWAKKYRSPYTITDAQRDEEEAETDIEEASFDPYGIPKIIDDGCFLPEAELSAALDRLRVKKNLILQGPPGTGKTWLAKRLAYALIGTQDRKITRKRMRVIQFHPSLSYEDFVRGWRPDGNGDLKLTDGVFLEAVEAARAERDRPFVVIIEEINRGNPAQIFGEMLTLLEKDKRREDEAIELAYHGEAGERVFIPDNLYVIGTMNIADRSLALVDLALRRRFAFITLETMLNNRWKKWCGEEAGLDDGIISKIQSRVVELNDEIAKDRSLGKQFRIGHSYVTPSKGEKIDNAITWFQQIVENEISPLLEEYWFDNPDKASDSSSKLLNDF